MRSKVVICILVLAILLPSLCLVSTVKASEPFSKSNRPADDPEYSVGNEYLTFYVEYGTFDGVGTATLKTADGYDLLYTSRDHDAWSSYLTVQIDGTNYANSPDPIDSSNMNPYVEEDPTIGTDKITTRWNVESIEIEQSVQLLGKAAMWNFTITNLGTGSRQLKLRYLFDYQVKDQDGAPIYADGRIYTEEVIFENPTFDTWQTWDQMPDPTLRGIATLQTRPYKIVFANWAWAEGHSFEYEEFDPNRAFYTPGEIYSPDSDSCALVYWNLGGLAAGETREVVTYYGIGSPSATKEQLIEELKALNAKTDESMEKQIDIYANLHTMTHVATWEHPAWTFAKIAIGVIARTPYAQRDLDQIKFLYNIVTAIQDTGMLTQYTASKIAQALTRVYDGLDPLSPPEESKLREQFRTELSGSMPIGDSENIHSYEEELDNLLDTLIDKLEMLPEEDFNEEMILYVRRIRSWMETIQSKEETIHYVDISSGDLIEARAVGSLYNCKVRLDQTLQWFKTEKFINDASFWVMLTGGLVKLGGWAFGVGTMGIGLLGSVTVEGVGAGIMAGGGLAKTGSSIAMDLTKEQATSIIELEATAILANDVNAIGDVYCATIDTIGKWSQLEDYKATDITLTLDQNEHILQEIPYSTLPPSALITVYYVADLNGRVTVTSTRDATGGVCIEIFGQEGEAPEMVVGGRIELAANKPASITFAAPLYGYMEPSENEKIYRVKAYVAVGTRLYGPYTQMFRVKRPGALVGQMSSQSISSSIKTGETYSQSIETQEGTSSLYLALDYPGSDLDLHLFDSEGRHVGVNYATGDLEIQIPNAKHSGPDARPEWISIKGDIGKESFTAKVVGVYADPEETFSLSIAQVKAPEDHVPPTTTIALDGDPGNDDWYLSDVTVRLEAEDNLGGTGLAETQYRMGTGEWITYSEPFTIGIEGITMISYRSVDNVGIIEEVKHQEVKIDKTPPTTDLKLDGITGGEGWYVSNVIVTLATSDKEGGSGVEETSYSFDGTSWSQYSGSFSIKTEGANTLYFNSIDVAGNKEDVKSVEISIDKTPPVIGIDCVPILTKEDVTPVIKVTDNLDKDPTESLTLDGNPYVMDSTITAEGEHKLVVEAIDDAGNVATEYVTFTIDKTPPEARISFDTNAMEIVVLGVDNLDPQVGVEILSDSVTGHWSNGGTGWERRTAVYRLTDEAGNFATIELEFVCGWTNRYHWSEVGATQISYNDGAPIALEKNSYNVAFESSEPKYVIGQVVYVKRNSLILMNYNRQKDATTIIQMAGLKIMEKVTKPGLVIVDLITDRGILKGNY